MQDTPAHPFLPLSTSSELQGAASSTAPSRCQKIKRQKLFLPDGFIFQETNRSKAFLCSAFDEVIFVDAF